MEEAELPQLNGFKLPLVNVSMLTYVSSKVIENTSGFVAVFYYTRLLCVRLYKHNSCVKLNVSHYMHFNVCILCYAKQQLQVTRLPDIYQMGFVH